MHNASMTLSLLHQRRSLHFIVATTPPVPKRRDLLLVCLPWVLILSLWSMNGRYVCRCFLAVPDVGFPVPTKRKCCCEKKREKEAKVMKEGSFMLQLHAVKKRKTK